MILSPSRVIATDCNIVVVIIISNKPQFLLSLLGVSFFSLSVRLVMAHTSNYLTFNEVTCLSGFHSPIYLTAVIITWPFTTTCDLLHITLLKYVSATNPLIDYCSQ